MGVAAGRFNESIRPHPTRKENLSSEFAPFSTNLAKSFAFLDDDCVPCLDFSNRID